MRSESSSHSLNGVLYQRHTEAGEGKVSSEENPKRFKWSVPKALS